MHQDYMLTRYTQLSFPMDRIDDSGVLPSLDMKVTQKCHGSVSSGGNENKHTGVILNCTESKHPRQLNYHNNLDFSLCL